MCISVLKSVLILFAWKTVFVQGKVRHPGEDSEDEEGQHVCQYCHGIIFPEGAWKIGLHAQPAHWTEDIEGCYEYA